MEKKDKELKPLTRAEKREEAQKLIKEILQNGNKKASELIDEASKIFAERFPSEETENINDVKGRVGSVLDIMKKDSEVMYDGGIYALKAREIPEKPVEKAEKKAVKAEPAKKTAKKTAKKAVEERAEPVQEVKTE